MAVEASAFLAAMRRFAQPVTIVATGTPGARAGLTATAVCSVSIEPPQLLVSVNRQAGANTTIQAQRRFSVNLLHHRQQALAERFAGREGLAGEERFLDPRWRWLEGSGGVPLLADALVAMACDVTQAVEVATHTLFIGEVQAVRQGENRPPLLYGQGQFLDAPNWPQSTERAVGG